LPFGKQAAYGAQCKSDTVGECFLHDRNAAKSPALRAAPFPKGGFWVPSFDKGGTGRISPTVSKVLVVQIATLFLVFALALFLPAGTIAWLAGWCFLILFFGFVVAISLWLLRHNPGLLQERMTGFKCPD